MFSSIAAYSSDVGETGINELLGGSMFVSNVVVGCVAMASTVKVQQTPFTRDVTALMLALMLLLVFATQHPSSNVDGRDIFQLLLLFMYTIYVSSAVVPACVYRFRYVQHQLQKTGEDTPHDVLVAFWHSLSPENTASSSPPYTFVTRSEATRDIGEYELGSPHRSASTFSSDVIDDHFYDDSESLSSPLIADDEYMNFEWEQKSDGVSFSTGAGIIESAYWRHLRWRWRTKRHIVQMYSGSENWLLKLLSVPLTVLGFIRDTTVPLLDQETWSRTLAMFSPITVPQLVLLVTETSDSLVGDSIPLWRILLLIGIITASIVSFTTHRSHAPDSFVYCSFFLLLAFVACVCWIYTIANELVALLVAVGTITQVSNSLLGLTVLSWGNSIGDLITNVSVARAGFPEMAIAGCYGGPVFNILLGLGIPMALAFLRNEQLEFALDDHAWMSMGFLFCSLTTSFWVFRHHSYHCPPWYGKMLVGFYAIYTILNVALAVW